MDPASIRAIALQLWNQRTALAITVPVKQDFVRQLEKKCDWDVENVCAAVVSIEDADVGVDPEEEEDVEVEEEEEEKEKEEEEEEEEAEE
jgi:hypothetical protein